VAGALFVAEVVMATTSMEVFGPLVCSSVVATLTIRQFLGADPLYSVVDFNAISPVQTLILVGLGCLCGFLSPAYLLILRSVESWFSFWPGPIFTRLAAGGLVVGVVALDPQVAATATARSISCMARLAGNRDRFRFEDFGDRATLAPVRGGPHSHALR
jgi:CIC family chloride channel protein